MAKNAIGDDGAKSLEGLLATSYRLVLLDLGFNAIRWAKLLIVNALNKLQCGRICCS